MSSKQYIVKQFDKHQGNTAIYHTLLEMFSGRVSFGIDKHL